MLTPMSFGMPELLIYVVPAFAGIIGSRYLTRLRTSASWSWSSNSTWQFCLLLAYHNRGQLMPLLFLQTIFVSAGSLIPLLVFILVAIVAYRLRRFASP